jgi:hypothetical protein
MEKMAVVVIISARVKAQAAILRASGFCNELFGKDFISVLRAMLSLGFQNFALWVETATCK